MAASSDSQRKLTQGERSADSRHRLMAAAIELIAEKGFDRTSTAEISERAGYSRSMVHVRYGSKEALLESLQRSFEGTFFVPSETGGSGLDQLLDQIDALSRQAREDREYSRAFQMLCIETVGPITGLRPWIEDFFGRYLARLADLVRLGQEDGSIRAGVDPAAEAEDFLQIGIGICFRWLMEDDLDAFESALARWRARQHSWLAPGH